MPRINPINPQAAEGQARDLLDGARRKLGMVPNLFATLAHSPAALGAYLGFGEALGRASLSAKLREQIALTVAGVNGRDYCASAHTAIGGGLGLEADELADNLAGRSGDARTAAALDFVRAIVEKRGRVTDDDLAAVRDAGFGDAEIAEMVAAVALNVFTNYFNHVADTEVDFPRVETAAACTVA